jgi:prepilin-type N-terminal cleavage/methylation domain-containing protein
MVFGRSSASRGFTLIELLVVIAMIAVLIAMLLPAVQKGREAANRAAASEKLNELATASLAYHTGNGQFPGSFAELLDVGGLPPDGAIFGFQLVPKTIDPQELLIHAEPIPGVTGGDKLILHVLPPPVEASLVSAVMPGAEEGREEMFRQLKLVAAQEIAALVYLWPYLEQDALYSEIRPFIADAPNQPEVMRVLAGLSRDGVFSLASFFAAAGCDPQIRDCEPTFRDPAVRPRFFTLVDRTRAVLQVGALHEGELTDGVNVAEVLRSGSQAAVPMYNYGDLRSLTAAYLPAIQLENQLLRLLDRALLAHNEANERGERRSLGAYTGLLQQVSGRLLPSVQADALIGIAKTLLPAQ